ncbi:MAG: hypothetical protein M0Q41_10215 [Bacteroidales bacterium]|nr:hypothetical protein [Bacteroidales bacterium]
MRNLKKYISNFYEWIELLEHNLHVFMQLQLISPTGRTLYEAPVKGKVDPLFG